MGSSILGLRTGQPEALHLVNVAQRRLRHVAYGCEAPRVDL